MIFSYNWLQDYIKEKLPKPEKLAELLTMHSFEVKEVKKKSSDWVLDIDVLPNRGPDCFSHIGIAREVAVLTDSRFHIPEIKIKEGKELKTADWIAVEVRSKSFCPRYTARVVTKVKVAPSAKWLKDRLEICGLRPINNIVDIANYVMLETGQPLHVFDGEKLEGRKIIVRLARGGEKIETLDGQKINLNPDILVIADNKKPLAIAGIKGGKSPEVDKATKTVVIESANFNPTIIRLASKSLALKTDSSLRFEHGIDPNLTEFAIARACYLIQKMACPAESRRAGGNIAKGSVDIYPKKVLPKKIKLDLGYVESLLGVKISEKEIKNILERLGFKIMGFGNPLLVEIPTRRLDVLIPEDLIEEIARIYGYEKIPAVFPTASLIPPKRNLDIFWEGMIKDILKEAGFTETYNYSFVGEAEARIFKYQNNELIKIENPVSIEQKYLQPSLIPNLLKNLKHNFKEGEKIRSFELGKIFSTQGGEKRQLSGLITGEAFYQLKGIIDLLLNKLGISNIWYDEYQAGLKGSKKYLWHPKKSALIKVGNQVVGFLGEISLKILEDLGISTKVVAFDFSFESLSKISSEEHEYRPLSRFPSAVRDIAILVPRGTKVVEVLNKINIAGGSLVRDVDLFDIYVGEELPQGKKNLAFRIVYQAKDHTLSSKEIDGIQKKIIKILEKDPTWQVRK